MWENITDLERPQMTIWRVRFLCCIAKAEDTSSQNVISTPFPLQQSMHERVSVVPYMHIACLVWRKMGTSINAFRVNFSP